MCLQISGCDILTDDVPSFWKSLEFYKLHLISYNCIDRWMMTLHIADRPLQSCPIACFKIGSETKVQGPLRLYCATASLQLECVLYFWWHRGNVLFIHLLHHNKKTFPYCQYNPDGFLPVRKDALWHIKNREVLDRASQKSRANLENTHRVNHIWAVQTLTTVIINGFLAQDTAILHIFHPSLFSFVLFSAWPPQT